MDKLYLMFSPFHSSERSCFSRESTPLNKENCFIVKLDGQLEVDYSFECMLDFLNISLRIFVSYCCFSNYGLGKYLVARLLTGSLLYIMSKKLSR